MPLRSVEAFEIIGSFASCPRPIARKKIATPSAREPPIRNCIIPPAKGIIAAKTSTAPKTKHVPTARPSFPVVQPVPVSSSLC